MKRLRGPDQGDSGAAGAAGGATADAGAPGVAPAPPAGMSDGAAACIKAALKAKTPDPQPAAAAAPAQPDEQTRCNGDAPQMLPQRKED